MPLATTARRIITYDRPSREPRGHRRAAFSKQTGATLVPPFDHPLIMAGQGTAALELLEEIPHLEALIAPIGGGGLLAGCATIAKALNPDIRIFGVEPRAGERYFSLASGRKIASKFPCPIPIADGLRSPQPGALTFPDPATPRRESAAGYRRRNPPNGEVPLDADEAAGRAERRRGGCGRAASETAPKHTLIGVILSGGNLDFEDLARY